MRAEQELLAAVKRGDVAGVTAALAAGHNDNAWAYGVDEALHAACFLGRHACLRPLLAAGADPNARGFYWGEWYHSWTARPIHKAARAGHPACVAALLAAAADPCAKCSEGSIADCTALHLGAGNVEVVRLLLKAAPQMAAMQDSQNRTPLHLWTGSLAVVHLLLEAAPHTAAVQDSQNRTPLHLGTGNFEVARLLLEAAPQTATMRDSNNRTPLDVAIHAAHSGSAQLLLATAELQPVAEITELLMQTLVRLDRVGQYDCLGRLALAVPVLVARLGVSLDAGDGFYTFQRYRSHMVSSSLAWWLPAMLRHSDAAAARLMPFLPPDRQRLRTLALCLVRYQRSLSARLPTPIAGRLLALAAAQHAAHRAHQQEWAARLAKLAKLLVSPLAFALLAVGIMYWMRTVWQPSKQ